MRSSSIQRVLAHLECSVDNLVRPQNRYLVAAIAALILWGISWFLYSPQSWSWNADYFEASRARDFFILCHNPLSRDLHEPLLAYRIAVPVIAWGLSLNDVGAYILQCLFSIAFLGVTYLAVARHCSTTVAFLCTAMLALSFGTAWTNCSPGFPDTFSGLLCSIALLRPTLGVGFIAGLGGMLNDERTVLAFPFVCFWWIYLNRRRDARALAISMGVGLGMALVVRHLLTVGVIGSGVVTPRVYELMWDNIKHLRPYTHSWPHWFANVFIGYRWAWLSLVPFAIDSLRSPPLYVARRVTWAFATILAVTILSLVTAGDVSRGTFYFFPAILIALVSDAQRSYASRARLLYLVILQSFTPILYFGSGGILQIFLPYPLVLLRTIGGVHL
jgi:hypothetical protein